MTDNEQIARLIPLDLVRPDPQQPRHLLPLDLAQALADGGSPLDILARLRTLAERDKWIRERLQELDALAHSIAQDGLMQPIRVIADGEDHYRIEEGERRWWAHHILVQQGKDEFRNINAFVVEKETTSVGLLRRRVAENVLRSGFTAIELARAMANRIQEIIAAEPELKRGEAELRVGTENGMSDRRVRQFVGLLTLSPEAQELAQQARLSENALRQVVSIKDTTRQLAAIRELMHPAQAKSRRKARTKKRGTSDNSRQSSGHDRKQANGKSSFHPKKSSRRGDEERGKAPMQRLLDLARSLSAKDLEKLERIAWARVIEKETDRRILMNLHNVLARGLGIAIAAQENEMESAHE